MTGMPSLAERQQELLAFWQNECELARSDVNKFMETCFHDDQTPGSPPFAQQPFHREWQAIWEKARISVIHGATGFGKSEQVVGHLLWRLGRNPSLRITILGKREENAKKLLLKMQRQIESNQALRQIFPSLRPGSVWNSEKLRLASAGLDITTNNVEVYGVDGSPTGVRGDIILADDVVDLENTRTSEQREKVIEFFDTVVQSRLTTHGQLHILANAWHKKDLPHTYAKRPGIFYRAYPAEHPVTGELLWPSFRPKAWLDQVKEGMTPHRYARMFLCRVSSDEAKVIEEAAITLALARGQGLKPVRALTQDLDRQGGIASTDALTRLGHAFASHMHIVIGVDLATGRKEKRRKSDLTVFFVVGLHANGDRQVLWVESGRWTAPQTLTKMLELEQRYHPNRFVVEANAAQIFLTQFAGEHPDFGAAIDEFTTSGLKWDESLGIEGIGVEMKAGRWLVPGPSKGESDGTYQARLTPQERDAYAEIGDAVAHLGEFSRAGHTADSTMGWYFAKEGVLRCLHGVFSHRQANPRDQQQRELAGNAGTVAALLPPAPQEPDIPAHIRAQFGL